MKKRKWIINKIAVGVATSVVVVAPVVYLSSCNSGAINTKGFQGFPDQLTFSGKNSSGTFDLAAIPSLPRGTEIEYTVKWTDPYQGSQVTLTKPLDLWNNEELTLKLVGINGEQVTDSHAKTYIVSGLPPSNTIYGAAQVQTIIPLPTDELKNAFIYKTIPLPNNKVISLYSNGPKTTNGGILIGSYERDPQKTQIQYTVDSVFSPKLVTPTPADPNDDLSQFSDSEYLLKNQDKTIVPWQLQISPDGSISKFEPLITTPTVDFSNTLWISNTFFSKNDKQQTPHSVLVKTQTALYNITRDPITVNYLAAQITIPQIGGNDVTINCRPIGTNNGNLIFNVTVAGQNKLAIGNIDENNKMTWVGTPVNIDRNLSEIAKLNDTTYIGISDTYDDPISLGDFVASLYLIKIDSSTSQLANPIVAPLPYTVLDKDIKKILPDMTLVPTDFERVNDSFGIFSSPRGIYEITLKSDGTGIYQDNSGTHPMPYEINPTLYSLDITFVQPSIYLLLGLSPMFDTDNKFIGTRQIIEVIETC